MICMGKRTFAFIAGGEEIILPVTPQSIETSTGIRIETVNIHGLGDLRIAGNRTLANINISSFFPANRYRFSNPKYSPQEYVRKFQNIIRSKKPVRFLIHGAGINLTVLISDIRFGEKDGPNDMYYTLSLSEYEASSVSGGTPPRPISGGYGSTTYTVQPGDTLWSIARRFLGSGHRYTEIMRANNIADPNAVQEGTVLVIPAR